MKRCAFSSRRRPSARQPRRCVERKRRRCDLLWPQVLILKLSRHPCFNKPCFSAAEPSAGTLASAVSTVSTVSFTVMLLLLPGDQRRAAPQKSGSNTTRPSFNASIRGQQRPRRMPKGRVMKGRRRGAEIAERWMFC
uniref:Uncharacterized protein n=1 Tax=Pygocentrus nattereri TaxID=42514 RepID=A0AAR2KP75_PYGNA